MKRFFTMAKKHRGLVIFGVLLCGALLFAGYVVIRVQKSLAPAPDTIPTAQQGVNDTPGLVEEVVLSGLSNVWDIAFLPDGTPLFTERAGTLSKIENGKKQVLHTIPDIYARGEAGLMGLAVDPDYSKNSYIYACYSTQSDVRVSRWKLNAKTDDLSDKNDIVTGIPVNTRFFPGRHSGCRIRFGADGNLWIGTGDAAGGSNPQDSQSLGGKILRVNRNGTGVRGNMRGSFDPRIYSYGHRNVQGLALYEKQIDGSYGFSVEHGPDKMDEINRLVPGNMGWNPVPLYNELVPMTDKSKYPEAIEAVWNSGDVTIAPSGMTFIIGAKWRSLQGQLAVAVLKNEHVRLLKLDKTGKNVLSEQLLFKNKYGRIRSVVMGPNQRLYLTTDNGDGQDEIIRVTPR